MLSGSPWTRKRVLDLAAGLLEPPGQVVAVGVAREAVEDVDGGVQVVPLVQDLDPFDPLGDLPAERPLGLVADDHDGVVGVVDDVPEVVADPPRLAHPRRGDDHHRARQVVEPPRVVPARAELDVLRAEVHRVLVHQPPRPGRVGLGMVAVDVGQPRSPADCRRRPGSGGPCGPRTAPGGSRPSAASGPG